MSFDGFFYIFLEGYTFFRCLNVVIFALMTLHFFSSFYQVHFPTLYQQNCSVCPTPATSAMATASLKYFGYSYSPLQVPY